MGREVAVCGRLQPSLSMALLDAGAVQNLKNSLYLAHHSLPLCSQNALAGVSVHLMVRQIGHSLWCCLVLPERTCSVSSSCGV